MWRLGVIFGVRGGAGDDRDGAQETEIAAVFVAAVFVVVKDFCREEFIVVNDVDSEEGVGWVLADGD